MTTPLRARIVVATQDPFGYYHFTPTLKHYLNQLGFVQHLIPVLPQRTGEPPRVTPEPPENHLAVTNDITSIANASIVIIVGGTLSYWTHAVAKRANQHDVPVLFLEADYPAISGVTVKIGDVNIAHTIVSSYDTQHIINNYFEINDDHSAVVGLPLVDDLPRWNPTDSARRILIATSVSSEMPDNGQALIDVADSLTQDGWDVVVSPHPKEDRSIWRDYEISKLSPIHTAANSDVVVTYPSSILVPLHVMRIPTVTMLFDERFLHIVPKSFLSLGEPTFDLEDTVRMVDDLSALAFNDAEPPTQTVSERVVRTIYPFVRERMLTTA